MSNKQRLDIANTKFEEQLIKMINELEEAKRPEGKYVWKKTVKIAKSVTNPIITLNGSNGVTKVTSDDFDLSEVDALFFDGFDSGYATNTVSDYRYLVIDGKLYYQWGSTSQRYETTYDPTTQTLTNNCTSAVDNGSKYGYVGTKTYYVDDETQTTYIVADDVNAFPDGGELDGYWYERVDNAVPETPDEPENNIIIKTGTYSPAYANNTSVTIPHGLGKVPAYCGISQIGIKPTTSLSSVQTLSVSADATNIVITITSSKVYISGDLPINWFAIG